MNLNFNAEDTKRYEDMLANNGGDFISDKDLPYVDSGLYQCEISSAFAGTANVGGKVEERINVTFIAFDKDGVTPVGKFTNNFTCDVNSDFFAKTYELCFLTGNPHGISEEPLKNKNGEDVVSKRDNTVVMHYPALKGKKLIACVYRKPKDYIMPDGTAKANYTVYGLYGMDKRETREVRGNLPATSIGKTYAFLQKKIKEDKEQAALLANVGGSMQEAYNVPKPQPQAKPQAMPEPCQPNPLDNLPF